MAGLNITLKDLITNSDRSIRLPKHVPISKLIPSLVSGQGLPVDKSDNPIKSYRLETEQGQVLQYNDTLYSAKINDGSTLILTKETKASRDKNSTLTLTEESKAGRDTDDDSTLTLTEENKADRDKGYESFINENIPVKPFLGTNINMELGVIRFEIIDNWSVTNFIKFLSTIETIYLRLNSFLFISTEFDAFINNIVRRKKANTSILDIFESILTASKRHTAELTIKQIKLSSPGFIEFTGNMNPLEIIADFITSWRNENTSRKQTSNKAETERFKGRLEITKIILERATELSSQGLEGSFVNKLITRAFDEPLELLTDISKDIRIQNVKYDSKDSVKSDKKSNK
jgi:hypothetical protein